MQQTIASTDKSGKYNNLSVPCSHIWKPASATTSIETTMEMETITEIEMAIANSMATSIEM